MTAIQSQPVAPAADLAERSDGTPREWVERLGVLLLFTLILVTRRMELLMRPAAWAEDAWVFFLGARDLGLSSLWTPHTGYFHAAPRIVALLGSGLAVGHVSAFYTYASLVVWVLVAAYIVCADLAVPRGVRYAMALSLVLVPHGGEIWMNLKNIQWPLALLLITVLLEREPRTARRAALVLGVAVLAGLTGPFVGVFLPFFVLRVVMERRSGHAWRLLGVALGCAVLHGWALLHSRRLHERSFNTDPVEWAKTAYAYLGGLFNAPPDNAWLVLPAVAAFVATIAVVLWSLWHADATARRNVAGMLGCGAALVLITFWEYRDTLFIRPLGVPTANAGPRYSFIPYVMVMWSLLWLGVHARRGGRAALGIVCLIAATTLFGGRYESVSPFEDELPAVAAAAPRPQTP